jgi:hypothetical protein
LRLAKDSIFAVMLVRFSQRATPPNMLITASIFAVTFDACKSGQLLSSLFKQFNEIRRDRSRAVVPKWFAGPIECSGICHEPFLRK